MLASVCGLRLVLIAVAIVDVCSVCLLSRPCPCGSSGKSYLRCFETLFQHYSCDDWINCQTCEDYNAFCSTCPAGRSGLTCKEETKEVEKRHLNQRRDFSEVKSQSKFFCKHPGVVENGIIEDFQSEVEQFPIGSSLRFLCRKGYERQGPKAIYCLRNLSWSQDPPVCKSEASVPTCKRPRGVENGIIQNDVPGLQNFPLGSALNFECIEGYKLVGSETIHCIRTFNFLANWSHPPPKCRRVPAITTSEIVCQNPGMVENGLYDNDLSQTQSFPIGTAVNFRCKEGYEIEGPRSIYCILPGEWSENPPKCRRIPNTSVSQVFCSHPGMVANGVFEGMSESRFSVGSALTFRCKPGTRMEGQKDIYCLRTGRWSATPPACKSISIPTKREPERNTCKHPGAIENGINEHSSAESYMASTQLKFKCKEDYVLVGQDTIRCESTGQWSSAPPKCRPKKNISDCGRVFHENYKLSGKHTRSDWPWTVGLSTLKENSAQKMFCGGALLNSRTVVTAAHCATGAQNIKLHFGYRRPIPEKVRNVSRIIIHPEYDDQTHANDIALMKFQHHVYYDPTTQPICLPIAALDSSGKGVSPGTIGFVAGYGLEFTTSHSSAPKFKVLELPVQAEDVCDPVCRDQGLVSCNPNTFCAGYLKDTKECIYGGTPLVILHKENNRYTLEGLVTRAESARNSWNGRCKRAESYATFTNVTHFLPFIYEHLN